MKRTFIALKIVPETEMRKCMMHAKNCLTGEKIRWVNTTSMHLTLAFLGDTVVDRIPGIIDGLKGITRDFSPLVLVLSQLGVFKNIPDARVLWIGIQSGGELARLKNQIDHLLGGFGFRAEKREFRPHLTIARIKHLKNRENLKKLLAEYENMEFQRSTIDELIYYESILKRGGAEYIALHRSVFSKHVSLE